MPFQLHRAPGSPLTQNQMQHLLLFLRAGAVSHDAAQSIYELRDANTMVIGGLCDKGLALKRQTAAKGRRLTLYWLTEAGVAEARAIDAREAKRIEAAAVRQRRRA